MPSLFIWQSFEGRLQVPGRDKIRLVRLSRMGRISLLEEEVCVLDLQAGVRVIGSVCLRNIEDIHLAMRVRHARIISAARCI